MKSENAYSVAERKLGMKPLFALGEVVVTPGALEHLSWMQIMRLVGRHVTGDWGDLDDEDIRENEISVKRGYRIFSAYFVGDTKFYVITEHDRSYTTILLPDEY